MEAAEGTAGGKKVKDLTLVFCRRAASDEGSGELLLGLKKRGFGTGKWNGEAVTADGHICRCR